MFCLLLLSLHVHEVLFEMYLMILDGSFFIFDQIVLRHFRKDGHNWRKTKDGKTIKENHEKLGAITEFTFGFESVVSASFPRDKHKIKITQLSSN
jgi:hypothetical protein